MRVGLCTRGGKWILRGDLYYTRPEHELLESDEESTLERAALFGELVGRDRKLSEGVRFVQTTNLRKGGTVLRLSMIRLSMTYK